MKEGKKGKGQVRRRGGVKKEERRGMRGIKMEGD